MFVELIATVFAGIAAAGIVLALNKGLGGRLPKWFMPVAAGLAMIGATVSNEYSWYPRTKASLPDGLVIAETVEAKALYKPWTYAYPYVERFMAVDTATIRKHDAAPSHRLVDIYLFGRWSPVSKLPILADCETRRRAALTDAISFESDGIVTGAEWLTPPEGDNMLATICEAS